MDLPLPLTRDVVLVGGGHTHALVLRKWGMQPLPGARLTLINPGPTAPYSGMLPGFVAGHYDRDALDIDLVRLARFAGARLILGAATGLDPEARVVHVPGRPPVAYDLCSLDIGITSDMPGLKGFDRHAVPAKPLGPFSQRWAAYLAGTGPADVAVLGAGVAGTELALAMAHALHRAGRPARIHLLDRGTALSDVSPGARRTLRAALAAHGVTLIEDTEVWEVTATALRLSDGREIPATFTTGAAGARAQGWLAGSGLALRDGFVTVDARLRSSDPAVFAVGDCAHMAFDPRPKAGVYAVRQAPVLHDNIVASLTGGPLRAYRPQKDYLKLISMGGRTALAQRMGHAISGPIMWRWKDRIDRRFMQRFRDLPDMEGPSLPPVRAQGMEAVLEGRPLCGGCGAKLGRDALRHGLAPLASGRRDDVRPLPGDDAALLRMGETRQVLSADHLRAFLHDPVLLTRIAAVHALGDIWAMGAEPQAAALSLVLPPLSPQLQARTLQEIIATADAVIAEAGAEIVGGHTSTGAELTIGLTLTGLCRHEPVTLAGGRPGDALILTRPLGSGVLLAAEMQGRARGAWIAAAWAQMALGQGRASALLAPDARAMTDVTGFGLAGHLHGLCEASGTGALLDLEAVPLMEGALELSEAGIRSSLFPENRALVPELPAEGKAALLFDPQTAGGLLAAVPPDAAGRLIEALAACGHPAARIGHLTEGPVRITLD